MKKVNITLTFDDDKLDALEFSLRKEHSSVQARMDDALKQLYEQTVPEAEREYLDSRKKSFCGSTSVGKMLSKSISRAKLCRSIWRMCWTSFAISFRSGSMSVSAVQSSRKLPHSVRRKKRPALMPPTM